jgi:hypothetical protein
MLSSKKSSQTGFGHTVISMIEGRRTARIQQLRMHFSAEEPRLPVSAEANKSILSPQEYDVHSTFKPKSQPNTTWVQSLSTNEYIALCAGVLIVPFFVASGASYLLRSYSARKLARTSTREARAYLQRVAVFDPRWLPRLLPPAPSALNLPANISYENEFPFLFDISRLPNGIPSKGWRNADMQGADAALRRVKSMSDVETRYFSLIYRNFAHAPKEHEIITKTLEWVLRGSVAPDDVRRGLLPRAAVSDLPAELRSEFLRGATAAEGAAPYLDELNAMKLRRAEPSAEPAAEKAAKNAD